MAKFSDDILKQIQAEIDRKGELPGSLEELNKIASSVMDKYNNAEVPDFEGLSPHNMFLLLNKPFSGGSPVTFNPSVNPAILASVPVIRVASLIMEAIRAENGLKLTPKGNLPRKGPLSSVTPIVVRQYSRLVSGSSGLIFSILQWNRNREPASFH